MLRGGVRSRDSLCVTRYIKYIVRRPNSEWSVKLRSDCRGVQVRRLHFPDLTGKSMPPVLRRKSAHKHTTRSVNKISTTSQAHSVFSVMVLSKMECACRVCYKNARYIKAHWGTLKTQNALPVIFVHIIFINRLEIEMQNFI